MPKAITDAIGRRILLRDVGVLETLRLFKALGNELSMNEAYLTLATFAIAASMIDDIPLPFPVNESGVEALLDRLGNHGVAAVIAALKTEPAIDPLAAAGNSQGTPP